MLHEHLPHFPLGICSHTKQLSWDLEEIVSLKISPGIIPLEIASKVQSGPKGLKFGCVQSLLINNVGIHASHYLN